MDAHLEAILLESCENFSDDVLRMWFLEVKAAMT